MSSVLILDVVLLTLVVVTGIAVIHVRNLFAATMLGGLYSLLMALVWSNMHALDVGFTEAAVGAGATTVLLLGCIASTGRHEKPSEPLHLPALAVVVLTGGLLIYGTVDMPAFGDPRAPIHTHRVPLLMQQRVGKLPAKGNLEGVDVHTPERADELTDAWLAGMAGEDLQEGHAKDDHGEHAKDDHGEHAKDDHGEHAKDGEDHGGGHHAHPDDDFNGHVTNSVTSLLATYRGYDTMFETAVIFTAGVSLILLLRRREDDIVEEFAQRPDKPATAAGKKGGDKA